MNTKTQLLKLLEHKRGAYISGAALAKELSVSRNAVWKAVELLRAEGYGISAATNKGYMLTSIGDALSEAGIAAHLQTEGVFRIDIRSSVESTNTTLRSLAAEGAPEGYVVVAETQSAGKGRMGKSFHSPAGHGAYFSLLLRPGQTSDSALITSAAAVAAALAIEQVTGVKVGIKWVNDLYLGEKKVCGILTEATYDMESGTIGSAVLGIGINTTKPEGGYPDGLEGIAAPLTPEKRGKDGERCRLIAATLDTFWGYYQNLSERSFLDEYRSRSVLLGRDIYVLANETERPARALAIDDDCRLVVRYSDGETAALNSGEVRVKPNNK